MNRTSTVGRRIVGALVGLVVGAPAMGALFLLVFYYADDDRNSDYAFLAFILTGLLGLLIGGILGAAGGATVMQKIAGQRSSFWRALLGAVLGLPAGALVASVAAGLPGLVPMDWVAVIVFPMSIVTGAVLGSGWKARQADAAGVQV